VVDRARCQAQGKRVEELVAAAFKAYRRAHRKRDSALAADFKRSTQPHSVKIECIGVWDTVDAVGMPVEELATVLDWFVRWRFHSYDLGDYVKHGYHALAIDDERKTFHPRLWDQSRRRDDSVEQWWFSGVHSNVGGGYPKQGMAYPSLYWIMRRAEKLGLDFRQDAFEEVLGAMNVHDKLYDSRAGAAVYYRYAPRGPQLWARSAPSGDSPKIHASVFHRIAGGTLGYAPGNLPKQYQVVVTDEGDPYTAGQGAPLDAEHLRDYAALQAQCAPFVSARKLLHLSFVLASVGILWGVVGLNMHALGTLDPDASGLQLLGQALWKIVSSPMDGLFGPLARYLWQHPERLGLGAGAVALLLGLRWLLRRNTTRRFEVFWSHTREALSGWLLSHRASIPSHSLVVGPPDATEEEPAAGGAPHD